MLYNDIHKMSCSLTLGTVYHQTITFAIILFVIKEWYVSHFCLVVDNT